jgi:hypothetical protein
MIYIGSTQNNVVSQVRESDQVEKMGENSVVYWGEEIVWASKTRMNGVLGDK